VSDEVPPPAPAAELAQLLDVDIDDEGLLDRALTHRSWAFENGGVEPNERLEFLGDAVLALVVTDELFHADPDARRAAWRRCAPRRSRPGRSPTSPASSGSGGSSSSAAARPSRGVPTRTRSSPTRSRR
jgi:hypothetical protein